MPWEVLWGLPRGAAALCCGAANGYYVQSLGGSETMAEGW